MELREDFLDFTITNQDVALVASELLLTLIFCFSLYGIILFIFKQTEKISFIRKMKEESKYVKRNIKIFFMFLCFSLCLGIIVFNAYLLYTHRSVVVYTKQWFELIPPDFWKQCGIAFLKIISFIIASMVSIIFIRRILFNLARRAKAYKKIKANDESIEVFFSALNRIQRNSIWLAVVIFTVRILPFPICFFSFFYIILKIYLIISLGFLLIDAITAIIDSLDALSQRYANSDTLLQSYKQLRNLIPLFCRCLEYITYTFVVTLVILQIKFIANLAIYGQRIAQFIGIFFICRVSVEVVNLIVDKLLFKKQKLSRIAEQRRMTLSPLIKSFCKYLIYFIGFIFILKSLSINPATVLAGAGIFGIIVGLGAQPLINDLVTGFFILFENLFLVGDFIETSSARGVVEAVDIRTSRIRDPDGQLHILRNGQLNEVINYSKQYTYAVVEVGVAYDSNLDHVYQVLESAGKKIKAKDNNVLEETEVCGLENFGESELLIRTITKVHPGCHLDVARKFRKVIKEEFDIAGIEIPFARRVIIFKNDADKDNMINADSSKN